MLLLVLSSLNGKNYFYMLNRKLFLHSGVLAFTCVFGLSSCQKTAKNQNSLLPEHEGVPQPVDVTQSAPRILTGLEPQQADPPGDVLPLLVHGLSAKMVQLDDSHQLRLTGYLADGATKLCEPEVQIQEDVIHVFLRAERDPDVIATTALVPFDMMVAIPAPMPVRIFLNGSLFFILQHKNDSSNTND